MKPREEDTIPPHRRIENDDLTGRTGRIWQAYIRGATQEAIAREHGIGQQRVSQILAAVREQIEPETIETFNARTLDLLSDLTARHLGIIDAGPTPKTTPTGNVVVDPRTGEPVPDWSPVLQASANVVRFTERAAKILGSDAAAKQDVTVTTSPEDLEVVQRIRAWKARQAAETSDTV